MTTDRKDNRQDAKIPLNYFRLGDLAVLAVSKSAPWRLCHLESAARLLPINFPQDDRLLAILDGDWIARVQFIAAARCLGGRVADENLSAFGI